jgi:hypothetical protein
MSIQTQPVTVTDNQLRELITRLAGPPQTTLADDLRESLTEISGNLELAAWYLGEIRETVASTRAARLARRRRSSAIADVAPVLGLFGWFLDEGLGQVDELTNALGTLLEPPHSGGVRYGRLTGIFPYTPSDPSRCGTWAGYQQHRRRGEDCPVCREAARIYSAGRRAARERAMWEVVAPWPGQQDVGHDAPQSREEINHDDSILRPGDHYPAA